MRYVTVEARPTGGGFHPLDRRLATDPDVTRRAIHRVELLADGTCAMLAEAYGDLDRLRAILAEAPSVEEFTVSDDDGRGFSYSRYEPTDAVRELMERRRRSPVVLDMPVVYTEDGGMRATYVGTAEAFAGGLDLPDAADVRIVETGEYAPERKDLLAHLTARQREVLRAAVDRGYYRAPRRTTHEEIAAAVGCSATTVGEHLRKVEATVFSTFLFGDGAPDGRVTSAFRDDPRSDRTDPASRRDGRG